MRRFIGLAVTALACVPMVWAQTPATSSLPGAPGRATPQPYAPVAPIHLPPSEQNPPLLKVPQAPALNVPRGDQDLPLLREQRQRALAPVPAVQD